MSLPQHFLVKLKEQLAISTLIKESVSLTKKVQMERFVPVP